MRAQRTPEKWFNTDGFERSPARQHAFNFRTLPTRLSSFLASIAPIGYSIHNERGFRLAYENRGAIPDSLLFPLDKSLRRPYGAAD
jgi:hypothetical protein